jgi:GT2 family glycosyltransferase
VAASATPNVDVVIVSYRDAGWLRPCLRTLLEHAGSARLNVVVVSNGGDDTPALVRREFPGVEVLECENRGFAHANNLALRAGSAPYALLLNPDTEITEGTLGALVAALEERPEVGLLGVRQVDSDGRLWPTIRYFPSALRALGDALGAERLARRPSWLGERELDESRYDGEVACDWTSGSFMLARREALEAAGLLDERFFIYSEEPDLCLRMKRAGWAVRHVPQMTIVHHAGRGGVRPQFVAQDVFTRRQYADKHFGALHRWSYLAAVGLGHALRAVVSRGPRREASRAALRTLFGRGAPPFAAPPATALSPEAPATPAAPARAA